MEKAAGEVRRLSRKNESRPFSDLLFKLSTATEQSECAYGKEQQGGWLGNAGRRYVRPCVTEAEFVKINTGTDT